MSSKYNNKSTKKDQRAAISHTPFPYNQTQQFELIFFNSCYLRCVNTQMTGNRL